jgi:hypothetical protein
MGKFKRLIDEHTIVFNCLLEGTGFTYSDYVKQVPSPRNIQFYQLRLKEGKTGSFLRDVVWDEKEDGLILKYEVVPTYKNVIQIVDKNGKKSKDDKYLIEIMFEDIEKNLGKKSEFLELKRKEQIDLFRLMMKKGTIKVNSNDYSWLYQGAFENASKLGYSIYPFKGVKGKGIWSRKHRGESPAVYVTKHIVEVMKTIPFIVNEIIKKINDSSGVKK